MKHILWQPGDVISYDNLEMSCCKTWNISYDNLEMSYPMTTWRCHVVKHETYPMTTTTNHDIYTNNDQNLEMSCCKTCPKITWQKGHCNISKTTMTGRGSKFQNLCKNDWHVQLCWTSRLFQGFLGSLWLENNHCFVSNILNIIMWSINITIYQILEKDNIDGLVQERRNSTASALTHRYYQHKHPTRFCNVTVVTWSFRG